MMPPAAPPPTQKSVHRCTASPPPARTIGAIAEVGVRVGKELIVGLASCPGDDVVQPVPLGVVQVLQVMVMAAAGRGQGAWVGRGVYWVEGGGGGWGAGCSSTQFGAVDVLNLLMDSCD